MQVNTGEQGARAGVRQRAVFVLDAALVPVVGGAGVDLREPRFGGEGLLRLALVQLFAGHGDLGVLLFRQAQDGIEIDGDELFLGGKLVRRRQLGTLLRLRRRKVGDLFRLLGPVGDWRDALGRGHRDDANGRRASRRQFDESDGRRDDAGPFRRGFGTARAKQRAARDNEAPGEPARAEAETGHDTASLPGNGGAPRASGP